MLVEFRISQIGVKEPYAKNIPYQSAISVFSPAVCNGVPSLAHRSFTVCPKVLQFARTSLGWIAGARVNACEKFHM